MIIILVKLLSLIIGVTVISKTVYDYKKHQESLTMFLFWTVMWLIIIYAAIDPATIYRLIQRFSVDNVGFGTFAGIAFVFLFFLTYRIYAKANRLEKKLHDMVMKLGIKDLDQE